VDPEHLFFRLTGVPRKGVRWFKGELGVSNAVRNVSGWGEL
jgi:hypothetical protein